MRGLLSDYIFGYLPGIPLQALTALLMAFVSFNNDMKRSYISAGVMSAGNLLGDLLLSGMGTLGIGLATTLSYAAGFLILLPGYLKTVDLACLGVILVSVWIRKGGFSFQTDALLKLPDGFGASPEALWECSLRGRDKVCDASESAVAFCLKNGISRRTASFAGLCIEEMARNIFQHGGASGKGRPCGRPHDRTERTDDPYSG